jgi:hypothetical protein
MGARAEYSLDGEGLPLPHTLVAEGHPDVQRWFENFLATRPALFERKLCVSARISGLSAGSPSLAAYSRKQKRHAQEGRGYCDLDALLIGRA